MTVTETTTRYISLDAAGELASLHPRTIRRAISAGDLPAYKFHRLLRVRVDELEAWMRSKAMPTAKSSRKAS